MREPWLTLTAGLVGGAALLTFVTLFVPGAYAVALPVGGFYALATCLLTWVPRRRLSVPLVWMAAVCLVAATAWPAGEQEPWGNVVLSGLTIGTLVVAPWLLATTALWHLLADPATRPGYDLDELHS